MDFTTLVVSDRSMVWYSTKNFPKSFSWDKFKDLTRYKFGVVRGEKFNKEVDHLISSAQIKSETVTDEVQNFKRLALGRIDALVKNEKVGWALVHELNISSLVKPAPNQPTRTLPNIVLASILFNICYFIIVGMKF